MREKLTRSDVAKIEAEIEHRKLVLRPQLIEAVKEARAQGDLSENFEYYAAKREKNQNESRIGYLDRMLKTAIIIDDANDDDRVALNKVVEVYFPEDDETESFRIVTSIRGDSLNGYISIESPFGKALLGHRAGDRVFVEAGAGGYEVEIRSVSAAQDDSSDAIRRF